MRRWLRLVKIVEAIVMAIMANEIFLRYASEQRGYYLSYVVDQFHFL